MTVNIYHGGCLDVLREMPDNSVDAIATDPPYGLSNTTPDKVTDAIVRWATGDREYIPAGKGFMSQTWDAFVPPPAVWDECFRVLKPGGHLVAFAGDRTQDLMGISIRLAGLEIRSSLAYLYGSGFPKSLDVSKAIDKHAQGHMRRAKLLHFVEAKGVDGKWLIAQGVADAKSFADWTIEDHCPSDRNWAKIRDALGVTPDEEAEFEREVIGQGKSGKTYGMGGLRGVETSTGAYEVTAAATDAAKRYEGVGTALKPAHEPIILARKPLGGSTVAQNTLTWGTGGLNIDKTRIGTQPAGRWPANVILDPDTAKALDQQSGNRPGFKSQTDRKSVDKFGGTDYGTGLMLEAGERQGYDDEGGASRFFKVVEPDPPFMYAAKAPKRERPAYVTEDGVTVQHSTVKPLSIMSWLVKLVTPEGGTVLDPFAGSGTTIEAAILEGFNVIGIEREAEYLPLIQQRIDRASNVLPMAS